MKLYFVRHGQTNGNVQKRCGNFLNDRLADNGCRQVQQIAQRIAKEPIDIILASPYERTKETAQIIAKKIGKDIQEIPLLEEKKWPNEIEGKLLNDPEVEKIFEPMRDKNTVDPDWHYSDEENFLDIKKRANLFIEYVSSRKENNILAVSHEYFIKLAVSTMIYGDRLSYEIFRIFFHHTSIDNASLTLCEKKDDAWKLITLNDLCR